MSDLSSYITDAANSFGLPPDLFAAQLQQESGTGTNLGSIGNIGQVTPNALTDINSTYGSSLTSADIATDPVEGIWAAAAYDAIRLKQSGGSYLGMLQGYGTLPSNPLSYTSSQEQLAETANNLDLFGSSNAGAAMTNPNAPLSGLASGTTGTVLGQVGSLLTFLTSGAGWERIGVIIIGIVLLGIAGFMLATKGFEGTIKTVGSKV